MVQKFRNYTQKFVLFNLIHLYCVWPLLKFENKNYKAIFRVAYNVKKIKALVRIKN